MPTHPTRRDRNQRQKLKARYMTAREDAQRFGLIPTTPEGAVRDERVDPATQGEQAHPALTRTAVRRGWAVPDAKKPELVDELVRVVADPDSTPMEKIASVRTLLAADRLQYERDRVDVASNVNDGGQTSPVMTYEQAMEFIREVEKQVGPIGPPAMRQIEEDARRVLPEEIIPPS
jgi:hypothetical protein